MAIARRPTSHLEPTLVDGQYASQRHRSAEILSADRDSFAQEGSQRHRTAYLVALDIEGAFDSAVLLSLMEVLGGRYLADSLAIPSRFIGNWRTIRTFRLRLMTPPGQYFSPPYAQSRGAPQGGSLFPLMWLLLFDGLPERVRGQLRLAAPDLDISEDFLLQIFLGDILAAIKGSTVTEARKLAAKLGKIPRKALSAIGLKLSFLKCKNFLVQTLRRVIKLSKRGGPTSRWQEAKGKVRQNAIQGLSAEQDGPRIT